MKVYKGQVLLALTCDVEVEAESVEHAAEMLREEWSLGDFEPFVTSVEVDDVDLISDEDEGSH